MADRRASADEARLWREAMRDARPLRPGDPPPPAPPPPLPIPPPVLPSKPAAPPPGSAGPPGLDKATRDRLRRGQIPIEARLDLHGMTREAAHQAVQRFVLSAAARELRCLLVITGKGRGGEVGVLKAELPHWLDRDPLRPLILARVAARPQHGGEGAVYLLLRRRR